MHGLLGVRKRTRGRRVPPVVVVTRWEGWREETRQRRKEAASRALCLVAATKFMQGVASYIELASVAQLRECASCSIDIKNMIPYLLENSLQLFFSFFVSFLLFFLRVNAFAACAVAARKLHCFNVGLRLRCCNTYESRCDAFIWDVSICLSLQKKKRKTLLVVRCIGAGV